jgi:nucleoside-diphosphate-sugar epimerase
MRVVITGAAGSIGREIVDDLSGSYELSLLDRKPVPGYETIIADLSKLSAKAQLSSGSEIGLRRWADAVEGAEVVVHLAEEPSSEATWHRVLHNNIQTTWNVLQASIRHKVRRFIYASSNFAVKALEMGLAPACYEPNGPKIGSDVQPRPINPYGIGKACGEITGRMLVDGEKLNSFLAVRIGWYEPNPPEIEGYQRLGIGAHDLRSLFRRCVEAEFEGFHVVYGVSAQTISPYDLSQTCNLLSWKPTQIP